MRTLQNVQNRIINGHDPMPSWINSDDQMSEDEDQYDNAPSHAPARARVRGGPAHAAA